MISWNLTSWRLTHVDPRKSAQSKAVATGVSTESRRRRQRHVFGDGEDVVDIVGFFDLDFPILLDDLEFGVVRKARLSGRYGPNATGWLLTGLGPHCREKKSKVGHQVFRRSMGAR